MGVWPPSRGRESNPRDDAVPAAEAQSRPPPVRAPRIFEPLCG